MADGHQRARIVGITQTGVDITLTMPYIWGIEGGHHGYAERSERANQASEPGMC